MASLMGSMTTLGGAAPSMASASRPPHLHLAGVPALRRPAPFVPHPVLSSARRAHVVAGAVETPTESPQQDSGAAAGTTSALQALAALSNLQSGSASAEEAGLAEVTKQVLLSDPETAEQLKRYQAALARVEAAKAAAVELEETFAQVSREVVQAEAQQEVGRKVKAKQTLADAEVQAAEKLLAAAQLEVQLAAQAQEQLARQAVRDADRVESAKVGAVATAGGLVSALPLLLASGATGTTAALSLLSTVASCFLFGVTYRYVVRLDEGDSHLRNGAVGAFGLVHAAAACDVLQAGSAAGPLDIDTVVGPGLFYTGQSMILFAFAAAAVEAAFRWGVVRRFGAPPPQQQQQQ